MKTALTLTCAALALSACATAQTTALDTGRSTAKAVVAPIVAETVPGPAGVVLTDCIIDNATAEELLRLTVQGASPENVALVSNILARPATVTCATSALT